MSRVRSSKRSAAAVLGPLLREALGGELPFGLRFWDGSSTGPRQSPVTLVIARRRALRRLVWAPDEIGLARAYVTGDLDVEGDLFVALKLVLDLVRPDDIVGQTSRRAHVGDARRGSGPAARCRAPAAPAEGGSPVARAPAHATT